jgi:hypothetical protein
MTKSFLQNKLELLWVLVFCVLCLCVGVELGMLWMMDTDCHPERLNYEQGYDKGVFDTLNGVGGDVVK